MTEQTLRTEGGEMIHLPCYMTGFLLDIERMNQMYELPFVEQTTETFEARLKQFKKILGDEFKELEDVETMIAEASATKVTYLDVQVAMADLLGDIIVYCASEAKRWGLPIDRVLHIIMESNWSKLDENGKPIKDQDTGKFLKGPNYWKPEPKIAALLKGESNA